MTHTLLAIIIFLFGMPFVALPSLRMFNKNKEAQLRYVTRFYDLAPGLIANEELPDDLVDSLEMLSRAIDDEKFVKISLRLWRRGEIGFRGDEKQIAYSNQVKALPKELRDRFMEALSVGLLASTYTAILEGSLIRRFLFSPAGMPRRTEDAPAFAYDVLSHCSV